MTSVRGLSEWEGKSLLENVWTHWRYVVLCPVSAVLGGLSVLCGGKKGCEQNCRPAQGSSAVTLNEQLVLSAYL